MITIYQENKKKIRIGRSSGYEEKAEKMKYMIKICFSS
jgi:hypothetical protein